MKRGKLQRLITYGICLLIILLCAGCSKTEEERTSSGVVYYNPNDTQQTDTTEESKPQRELFLILSNNSAEQTLNLYSYDTELQYRYYYGLTTRFLNKYGDYASAAVFTPGCAVHIGETDSTGKLISVQLSDDVWEYKDVRRFSIEEERNIFEIADTRYNYDEQTFVFSYDDEIAMSEISKKDELTVIGQEKKILAVVVTTGQGTIQLSNTQLFEGSFLQMNRDIFAEITPNMSLEVPEGTYTVTVANNGWGGSCEVTIVRGETSTIDLDAIKGDGPKFGTILFSVNVEDATVLVDGAKIDTTNPQSLQYGKHTISVSAEGYEAWTKYLYVNSKEATIIIDLEKTTENDSTQSDTEEEDSSQEDETEEEEEEETDSELELMKDYFSTLTELIGSM